MADHYFAIVPGQVERAVAEPQSKIIVGTASQAALPTPPAPYLTSSASGGSIGAVTVYVEITLVDANGETVASGESSVTFASGSTNEVVVTSPTQIGGATGYKVYAATTSGSEEVQNSGTAIAIGTNYTITAVATGTATPPASNTTGKAVIELRVPDALAGEAGSVKNRQRMTIQLACEALEQYFNDAVRYTTPNWPIGG